MGKIERVLRIGRFEDVDEKKKIDAYRTGCLAMPPNERVSEMRRLSRRVISLNPKNPRSSRIKRGLVRVVHDAI